MTAFKKASGSKSGFSLPTNSDMGDLCHGWLTPELTGGMMRVKVAAQMEPGTFEKPPAQSRSTKSYPGTISAHAAQTNER